MSETNGRWITLKGGRRVFVEEGGSISDAIKKYDAKKGKKIKGAYDKKKHLTKEKEELLDFKDRRNQQIQESLAVLEPKLKEAQKRLEEIGPWTKKNSGAHLTRRQEVQYYEDQMEHVGKGRAQINERLELYDKEINNPTRYTRIKKQYKDGDVYKRKGMSDDRYKVKRLDDGRYQLAYGNKQGFNESGSIGTKAEIHNLLSNSRYEKMKNISGPKTAYSQFEDMQVKTGKIIDEGWSKGYTDDQILNSTKYNKMYEKYEIMSGLTKKGNQFKKKNRNKPETKRKRTPKEQAWIDKVVEGHRAYD